MDQEELLFGKNPVFEALRAGREINKLLIQQGESERNLQEIIALAKAKKIPIQILIKRAMEEKAEGGVHQGVIAYVSPIAYVEVDEMLARAKEKNEIPYLLILDHLSDPHNLGAILRTADACGCHGVIIPNRRSVSVNSTVAKTSAGAVEYVPIARVANLVQTIDKLKEVGCWIAGLEADGGQIFTDADFKMPLAVVIGSEGEGISRLVREHCDFLVHIPMCGKINSLNASVATSVISYEVHRQRNIS